MNHNIFKIIIDKVALNQWQQKINQVNQEYHRYFLYEINCLVLRNILLCKPYVVYGRMLYNWRKWRSNLIIYNHINNHKISYCFECGEVHPQDVDIECSLPKNY